jgi:hypothetical protein
MDFQDAINIVEEIKPLEKGKKGCILFDIDDCLLQADSKAIGIIKREPGKDPVRLSTDQYAKDPDAATHRGWFSYEEFRDPEKVYASIVGGTPLLRQMRLLDAHVKANYDIAFLTARGLQDVVDAALRAFLKVKDDNGKLSPIGDRLKSEISAAVNDEIKAYPGANDPEKKGMVIKNICQKYDKVKFVDDDLKNVNFAKSLKLPNLQVILANKAPLTRGITEDVLEEEISKKVTKKLDKLEKLANKFESDSNKIITRMSAAMKKREGKAISSGAIEAFKKTTLQLKKAQEELKNIKELKKFNDNVTPETKEDAKELEKQMVAVLKEAKRQIKDSMNDPAIKVILRDLGIFTLLGGLGGTISLLTGNMMGLTGFAIGAYDVAVIHNNRENRRMKALNTYRSIKYSSKKKSEVN